MPGEDAARRFESTAPYYADYRPGYGEDAMDYLAERFDLGPDSTVLDLGCGAGQVTLPLAERAGRVVGMDPNEPMLDAARERAADAGVQNVEWVVGSDEALPAAVEAFAPLDLTTMGRSFHWMDQSRTLDALRELAKSGGGVALVTDEEWLVRGTADWQDAVYDVVTDFLDDVPERTGPVTYDDPWDETLADHGLADVETRAFDQEREWTVDEVVGYVLSLSYCSPARFGDDRGAFEARVHERLDGVEEPLVQDATIEVVSGRA